ncbi:16S rRNA (cytosine(967)-C(5))-methyltransferase RsmB [Utexia brackfieldae]|uniref:16S rRNA (cytosine(967)-C(5))-methyltransferase RsmB n=1 Tax=Utexia brackfieldae TaxID=3074108 RepID=UPI00370DB82F
MKKTINLRAVAANTLYQVMEKGQSLSVALPPLQKPLDDKDSALVAEICFGILRTLPKQEFIIQQLMDKVLTGKNRILHYLLMVGIYQLTQTRVPPHAAIAETVNAAVSLKKMAFKGLVNGVLRQFQRQQNELTTLFEQKGNQSLHPTWLLKRIQQAYPDNWSHIIEANNQKPPMWLRVNQQHHTTDGYLQLLSAEDIEAKKSEQLDGAIQLASPIAVTRLPGFAEGWVTVQDLSAQQAGKLLAPKNHELILDVCAAPGGKTTHILEIAPQARVMAVDIDQYRLKKVAENLARLNQSADIKVGDGRYPEQFCQGLLFDRILLDAPCSATGVIRRHPDIKWLRHDNDIDELSTLQSEILQAIWPYLKPEGVLVYATCSILPEENQLQIARFLTQVQDAVVLDQMIQHVPTNQGGDGFFYTVLRKKLL